MSLDISLLIYNRRIYCEQKNDTLAHLFSINLGLLVAYIPHHLLQMLHTVIQNVKSPLLMMPNMLTPILTNAAIWELNRQNSTRKSPLAPRRWHARAARFRCPYLSFYFIIEIYCWNIGSKDDNQNEKGYKWVHEFTFLKTIWVNFTLICNVAHNKWWSWWPASTNWKFSHQIQ